MTLFNEGREQNRIGRMLSLMGGLLQEVGSLVEAPAPLQAREERAHGESANLQAVPPSPASGPAAAPAAVPAASAPAPQADAAGMRARADAAGIGMSAGADVTGAGMGAAMDAAGTGSPSAASPAAVPGDSKKPTDSLYLVCEQPDGKVVFPWEWLAGTCLSAGGDLEGFVVSDGSTDASMRVDRVLGLWTRREIEASAEQLQWLGSASEIAKLPHAPANGGVCASHAAADAHAPAPAAAAPARKPARPTIVPPTLEPSLDQPTATRVNRAPAPALAAVPTPAPIAAGPFAPASAPDCAVPRPVLAVEPREDRARRETPASRPAPVPARVGVASPSALARRFLMRHLCDLGFEVLEARDLDDPILPADLGGVAALFLDESLLEDWKTRPVSMRGAPPLVCLTVDGELRVPPDALRSPGGAVLPRPFERAQVERVVHWLRSLEQGRAPEGNGDDGEEDDTWLFADPFRASRAGEHSRR